MRGMHQQGMVLKRVKAVGLLGRWRLRMCSGSLRMRNSCTGSLTVMPSEMVSDLSELVVVSEMTEMGQRIKVGKGEEERVDEKEVVIVVLLRM